MKYAAVIDFNLYLIHSLSFQCLTHTHHLGIDTQLFVLSPILILILWKWPKLGSIGLISVAILSTAARFYVTIAHELSNYVYFGASYVICLVQIHRNFFSFSLSSLVIRI